MQFCGVLVALSHYIEEQMHPVIMTRNGQANLGKLVMFRQHDLPR